ncbi:MAG: hypothetical protein AAGA93_13795 [Actinomycetota bacterium]
MAAFSYAGTTVAVSDDIIDSHRSAWDQLGQVGTWWTAAERLGIAARARHRFADRATPPWLRSDPPGDDRLAPEVGVVVDLVTLDAARIDRAAADEAVASLGAGDERRGQGRYVELIGIVAVVAMIDVFAEAVGVDPEPLPEPLPGDPSEVRPDGLGDIGAHVPAIDPFPAANVARALSLVPATNTLFRTVSVPAYSAPGFDRLTWDTPLSRPQVELVASRVAAMNECFY